MIRSILIAQIQNLGQKFGPRCFVVNFHQLFSLYFLKKRIRTA
jgi:hypothetical protein